MSKYAKFALVAVVLVGLGLAGLWLARTQLAGAPQAADCTQGEALYWYDPMVPAQRFDAPGPSPFMDMQLVPRCSEAAAAAAAPGERKALYWYDPMVPAQRFDAPGKSPFMDMQLVPKYADEGGDAGGAAAGSIAVDARVVQTLGVRIAPVEQGSFSRVVDTVGRVAVDEHRIEVVQVRAPGWVEQLAVRAVGDPVRRGQLLAAVYSPELLAAQEEFLLALRLAEPTLIDAARARLRLAGLSQEQIARVEKTRQAERSIRYHSPLEGYVMHLGVRQGASVQMETVLFELADLGRVWIHAEVPEAQAAWIKAGDSVEAEVPALPGERFAGTVDYLYPELSAATRTLRLRAVLDNPGSRLRPGMFATVQLKGIPKQNVLMVPTEAVIKTGERSVVIVADDDNHFRPALVRVGAESHGRSEIIEGLTLGQRVVASGQFLIDSEASLRGAFNNLTGSGEDDALMPAPSAGGGN